MRTINKFERVLGTIMLVVLLVIIVTVTYKKWTAKSEVEPSTTTSVVVDSVISIEQLVADSIAAAKVEVAAFTDYFEVKEAYVSGLDSLTRLDHELIRSTERGERTMESIDSTLERHHLERQILGDKYGSTIDSLKLIWSEKYHEYAEVSTKLLKARRAQNNN